MAHHSATGLSLVPGHSGLLALSSSSPVLVAFSSSFDHARHSLLTKIPRETIVSWTWTRTTFQGRVDKTALLFLLSARLPLSSPSIRSDKDRSHG